MISSFNLCERGLEVSERAGCAILGRAASCVPEIITVCDALVAVDVPDIILNSKILSVYEALKQATALVEKAVCTWNEPKKRYAQTCVSPKKVIFLCPLPLWRVKYNLSSEFGRYLSIKIGCICCSNYSAHNLSTIRQKNYLSILCARNFGCLSIDTVLDQFWYLRTCKKPFCLESIYLKNHCRNLHNF